MQSSVNRKLVLFLAALAGAVGMGTARADTEATPSTEYTRRIKLAETVQPLGETPFGENINLYNGTVSFRQTDISYPGIGPTITLSRSFEASGAPTSKANELPMADWDLSIPRISTIVSGDRQHTTGIWKVLPKIITKTGTVSLARCSGITEIDHSPYGYGMAWWHGYQLITEDGNSQPLLKRNAGNTLAPGNDTARYPVVTSGHWMLSCLPATANGLAGEAFEALSPDGTKYRFNHLAYGPALETVYETIPRESLSVAAASPGLVAGSSLVAQDDDPPEGIDICACLKYQVLPRIMGHLYATRVEDRFGNWLTYHYNAKNQLIEINASDLRKVSIAWRTDAPLVSAITLQPGTPGARTWRYEYAFPTDPLNRTLTRVVQPDATTWELEMGYANMISVPPANADNECGVRTFTQIPADEGWGIISVGHPSGLVGTFLLSLRGHARSRVPSMCGQKSTSSPWMDWLPSVYTALSLTKKTVEGPGVPPMTWTYRYSPAIGSTVEECAAAGCRDWKWVEVTDPSQETSHYQFSTAWGPSEGRLQSTVAAVTVTGQDNPAGLQMERITHADTALAWPFPVIAGELLADRLSFSNTLPSVTIAPQVLREITRQGVVFSRKTTGFDRFGQPETVQRFNTLGASITETTSYWPVDGAWVLGQPWKQSQDGKLVAQTDYDAKVLPARTYRFGLLSATYAYHSNGLLASITDPLLKVTRLDDYYRGVPRLIKFADTNTVVPGPDDFGQIRSVKNQLGDTTTYDYDSMGRMTRLGYPTGDSMAWNPVNRKFERSLVPAYGLPPFHWKQTVDTGNGKVTTLFDAFWRPRLLITEDVANPDSRSFVVKRYDSAGREQFSSYPVASLASVDDSLLGTFASYDGLGRVYQSGQSSELGGLVSTTEYLSGFRTRVTNPRKFQTTTSFQVFDEPTEQTPIRIEAPEGVTTIIDRDVFGKPLSIRREGPAG
jgi:YD repeat-containing protein